MKSVFGYDSWPEILASRICKYVLLIVAAVKRCIFAICTWSNLRLNEMTSRVDTTWPLFFLSCVYLMRTCLGWPWTVFDTLILSFLSFWLHESPLRSREALHSTINKRHSFRRSIRDGEHSPRLIDYFTNLACCSVHQPINTLKTLTLTTHKRTLFILSPLSQAT